MAIDSTCLGVIETDGLCLAIEAADGMLKSGKVTLLGVLIAGGGRGAALIRGDLGPVQAAVEAGVAAASRKGKVLARNVIPRCDQHLLAHLSRLIGEEAKVAQERSDPG